MFGIVGARLLQVLRSGVQERRRAKQPGEFRKDLYLGQHQRNPVKNKI
jgi:hypothetical protein